MNQLLFNALFRLGKSRLILLLISTSVASGGSPVSSILSRISEDSLETHVAILSSDRFAGRGTGTAGGELAARYIATRLDKYNVFPGAAQGSYYQSIPMHGNVPLAESRLRMYLLNRVRDFELKRDYLLLKSGAQTFIPEPLPLVFVGYGITAPEF